MLSAAESWNSTAIAEMLSASSNSVVLSILWARRYEISNNLISTSKFHKLLEVAAPGTWAHRYQTNGPLWGDKDLYAEIWHKGPKHAHWSTQYSLGNVPRKELLECSSSEHHWVPFETRDFSEVVCSLHHHLPTFIPHEKSQILLKSTEPSWVHISLLCFWFPMKILVTETRILECFPLSANIKEIILWLFWIHVTSNTLYRPILMF